MAWKEYVTHKDLMEFYEKISKEAKDDRHYVAWQIQKFVLEIDGKFDDLKDSFPNIAIIQERVKDLKEWHKKLEENDEHLEWRLTKIENKMIVWGTIICIVGSIGWFIIQILISKFL